MSDAGRPDEHRPARLGRRDLRPRLRSRSVEWAQEVLERLELSGDEARARRRLRQRPRHRDAGRAAAARAAWSPSTARPRWSRRRASGSATGVELLVADLAELELDEPVDVVFSNADLPLDPRPRPPLPRLHAALRPGGRLVAQCGGDGNVAGLAAAIAEVAAASASRPTSRDSASAWNFAGARGDGGAAARAPASTRSAAGWSRSPSAAPSRAEFLRTVCLGPHLDRLPEELARALRRRRRSARWASRWSLDYVRLNIDARPRSVTP